MVRSPLLGAMGSIPALGIKIPKAPQCSHKKRSEKAAIVPKTTGCQASLWRTHMNTDLLASLLGVLVWAHSSVSLSLRLGLSSLSPLYSCPLCPLTVASGSPPAVVPTASHALLHLHKHEKPKQE